MRACSGVHRPTIPRATQPQQRGLAALGVGEADQVRLGGRIQLDAGEAVLVDADRDADAPPGGQVGERRCATGSSRTGANPGPRPGRPRRAATSAGRVGVGGHRGGRRARAARRRGRARGRGGRAPWRRGAGRPPTRRARPAAAPTALPSRSLSAGRSSLPPGGRHGQVQPVGQALRRQRAAAGPPGRRTPPRRTR